jgi:steroid delta-isomerase-like uncharacterized protein
MRAPTRVLHTLSSSLVALAVVLGDAGSVVAQTNGARVEARRTDERNMKTYKKLVTLWYEAFDNKDAALIDRILSANWVDIPAPPGQPAGPAGLKQILVELTTAFPDLKITIQDILQDGNKVIVRSEIAGTHKQALMGFAPKNRTMKIQAVDIHEFKDGRIVRTWHTEDWLTGLHQLGVFEK